MQPDTHPITSPDFSTSPEHIKALQITALNLRRGVVKLIRRSRSGHLGGSLSLADIMAVLYFSVLRADPARPDWPERDRLVLSKGHAAPILFVSLAQRGYFPSSRLKEHRKLNGRVQGHPDRKTPGVEVATGSLGQGLSVVNGFNLAARLEGSDRRAVAILGDGECDEGQVWEAALSAAHHRLPTVAVLDRNRLQIGGSTEQVKRLEPLADKWRAFGWQVEEIDGHNMAQLLNALQVAWQRTDGPVMILANTVKGKGVSFMENQVDYHAMVPPDALFEKALAELDQQASLLKA